MDFILAAWISAIRIGLGDLIEEFGVGQILGVWKVLLILSVWNVEEFGGGQMLGVWKVGL